MICILGQIQPYEKTPVIVVAGNFHVDHFLYTKSICGQKTASSGPGEKSGRYSICKTFCTGAAEKEKDGGCRDELISPLFKKNISRRDAKAQKKISRLGVFALLREIFY
jgi:hypothetical protein